MTRFSEASLLRGFDPGPQAPPVGGEGVVRTLEHAPVVLEGARLRAPVRLEGEAALRPRGPRHQGQAEEAAGVLGGEGPGGTRLPPARLVGRFEGRVSILVDLLPHEGDQAQGAAAQAHPALRADPARAQRLVVLGEGGLRERVAEDRAPQPPAAAPDGAAQLGPHLAHAFGLVAEERPALELRREVVRLEAGPGPAQMRASRAPRVGRAQGQLDLYPRRAHAHAIGAGSGHEAGERVQVGIEEGRAHGRGVGHVDAVHRPGRSRPGVAVGDEERLLLAVGPAHVHAVHHHSRHVAQDRPGIGGALWARRLLGAHGERAGEESRETAGDEEGRRDSSQHARGI